MISPPPWTLPTPEPQPPVATEDALDFVLRAERGSGDLGIDRDRPDVVEVAQIWHDIVLDVQHHRPRVEPLTIGSTTGFRWRFLGLPLGWVPEGFARVAWLLAPMLSEAPQERRNDFYCPPEACPEDDFPLVSWSAGQPSFHVAAGWSGFVECDGRHSSLDDLRQDGRLRPDELGRQSLALGPGERLVLETGAGTFATHLVPPGKRVPTRMADRVDGPFMAFLGCAAFVGAMCGILMATSPGSLDVATIELPSRFAEVFLSDPVPEQRVESPKQSDVGETAKAKKPKGKRGREDAEMKVAKGDATDMDRHQMDKEIAEAAGVLGALRDGSELDGVLGAAGLSPDILGGIGGLLGAKGVQYGSRGLSSRGGGFGGGGTAYGVGGLGTKGRGEGESGYGWRSGQHGGKQEREIVNPGGEAIIIGQLDRAVVDAVVRRHLSNIRYCYMRELQKEPTLSGKVTVKFVIAGDGSVSSATTKSSTLDSVSTESCINGRFMRMEFPAPKRNGIVLVTYPFLFAPG